MLSFKNQNSLNYLNSLPFGAMIDRSQMPPFHIYFNFAGEKCRVQHSAKKGDDG